MTHTLTTTIATECTPERARRVVAVLQANDWPVEFGEETNLPKSDEFREAFYRAVDEVDFNWKRRK